LRRTSINGWSWESTNIPRWWINLCLNLDITTWRRHHLGLRLSNSSRRSHNWRPHVSLLANRRLNVWSRRRSNWEPWSRTCSWRSTLRSNDILSWWHYVALLLLDLGSKRLMRWWILSYRRSNSWRWLIYWGYM
jgi:hypothetical protein